MRPCYHPKCVQHVGAFEMPKIGGLFVRVLGFQFCLAATASAQGTSAREPEFPPWFIAVPLLMIVLALGLAWYAWRQWAAVRESRSWPTTQGTILRTEITSWQGAQDTMYEPLVRYTYEVGGQSYESERVRFGKFWETEEGARAILDRYPLGGSVEVHYNPADPSAATLEAKAAGTIQLFSVCFGALVLLGLAAFMFYRMWFW